MQRRSKPLSQRDKQAFNFARISFIPAYYTMLNCTYTPAMRTTPATRPAVPLFPAQVAALHINPTYIINILHSF